MAISARTRVMLASYSGNQCSMPNCGTPLTVEGVAGGAYSQRGEAAHIKGDNPGSARYDALQPDAERDAFENLIWVCPTCHKTIDDQPDRYPVEALIGYKCTHRESIRTRVFEEMPGLEFAELEVVARHLMGVASSPTGEFTAPDIADKMRRNSLTQDNAGFYVNQGLSQFNRVHAYLESQARLDSSFPERVKAGFIKRFNEGVADGLDGDALFALLLQHATIGSADMRRQAAGAAILTYYFSLCEVFE